MKGDIPGAALRLLSTLKVRTHYQPEPASEHWRAVAKANNTRPVVVAGEWYESLTDAGRRLGCCREKIRNLIKAGAARYV